MTTPTPIGHCLDCNQPMYTKTAPPGYLRHRGRGYCSPCGNRRRRAALKQDDDTPQPPRIEHIIETLTSAPANSATSDDWMTDAACAQIGPADDYFFPEKGFSLKPAKNICNSTCEVRAQCLAFALKNRIPHGVWGGLSAQERNKILREMPEEAA